MLTCESIAVAAPAPGCSLMDLESMSNEKLQEVLARCERLLSQPLVLARLPGKKEELIIRLESCRRLLAERGPSKSARAAAAESCEVSAAAVLSASREADLEYQRVIGDKYRHHRPNLEEEMHKSFGTLLSEDEIRKRVSEIPNPSTFLMTFDETLQMERASMARERRRELERMRQQRETIMSRQIEQESKCDVSEAAAKTVFGA